MKRIDPKKLTIHINKIPPKLFDFDVVALDTEFFDQDKERLHRPHGTFASLQATSNGKDVYVITDVQLLPALFEAIDEAAPIWHNATYDYTQLRDYDELLHEWLTDRTDLWDTMIVEQIMFSGYYASFSLQSLARRWCGIYMDKSERETFGAPKKKKLKKGEIEQPIMQHEPMTATQIEYAAMDVVALLEVYAKQSEAITETQTNLYKKIDLPCMWALLDMGGIYFDSMRWLEIAQEKEGRASPIWDKISSSYEVNGKPLNIRSGQQLKAFLRLQGIKVKSTTKKELSLHAGEHPVIDAVIAYKPDQKGSSTYGEKWLTYVESDGRIHCSWNMNRAATCRFSATNPPLQTIPVRKEKVYRECFIAENNDEDDGNVLIIADFSAQEPRIMAYMSGDEKLSGIFERNEDVYIGVGFEVFDEKFDKKDPRRSEMKSLVLGLDYGMTPVGLLRKLREDNPGNEKYTDKYAEQLVATFFKKFPGVQQYIKDHINMARKLGYVETIFGRRLHISPYGRLETQAPNFPIQGSAGDAGKIAVARIAKKWRKSHGYNPIRLMIHDELVCECPKKDAKELADLMNKEMVKAAEQMHVGIPSIVEIDMGPTWASKH